MKLNLTTLLWVAVCWLAGTVAAAAQSPAPPDSIRLDSYPYMDPDNPRPYIIKDIVVHGTQNVDPELIVSLSQMHRGDTVTLPGEYLIDATRRLWSLQQYSDVKTLVQTDADSAYIHVYLTQQPLVSRWEFDGVRKGESSALLEKLDIKRGLPLTDFRVKTFTNLIKEYFYGKSFLNVDVKLQTRTDTTMRNSIIATFVIDKKEKVKIGKVDFAGNDHFKARRLRRTLKKTNQKSINIFKSSKFNEKEYETDQANVIDFYNSKGYRNAMIVSDSIYPINDRRIGIKMNVEEGDVFYYRNVDWMGNSVYSTEQLNSLLGIEKGQTYDRKTLDKQLGIRTGLDPFATSVNTLYQDNGYLMSSIEPQEIVVGRDSIDLQIKIQEGKPFSINQVYISGNNRVFDRAIRREIDAVPGELYNQQLLISTMQRLGQMNHFTQESTTPRVIPAMGSNDLVDLSYQLEEQPSDQVEVSGGWGSGMFVGSVRVTFTNFNLADALKLKAWRPYPHGENQQLSISGQSNGQYYKALSMSFTDPWFGGKKPNSFSIGLYYSDQTDAYYIWQTSNRHFRTMGASVGLGQRLQWPDRMFQIYNELMYQSYNLQDWSGFLGFSNGTANIVALTTQLSRNTVSNVYFPDGGSTLSLGVSLTPPYSLFDGKDYSPTSSLTSQERNRWIEYHKWTLSGDWYFPLTNNRKLVLRAHTEMGLVGSYNKDKISPFEGYQVGGDGMAGYNLYGVDVVGLRGYENGSLTNSDVGQSRAYNKYIAELRYLAFQQGSTMIYGLAFAEAGNAFASVREFDPFLLKRSVGVGVRLLLPMVGLVGIDYGYGFDRDIYGNKGGGNTHFIIGQNF
ncbi:MAG: BamA/TamA family outer membrane protein [Rikenellaceae bacterium]|jgi:outer membrane protein insertion porin family|nr:BamA/TamA family outer membrane protein [Rikenellaceae bacterium]